MLFASTLNTDVESAKSFHGEDKASAPPPPIASRVENCHEPPDIFEETMTYHILRRYMRADSSNSLHTISTRPWHELQLQQKCQDPINSITHAATASHSSVAT